jgi:hypothetical protein
MMEVIIPVYSAEEKASRFEENFKIYAEVASRLDKADDATKDDTNFITKRIGEIRAKYNIVEISDEQLFLLRTKLESFEKESSDLLGLLLEILDSKYNEESKKKIFEGYTNELKILKKFNLNNA